MAELHLSHPSVPQLSAALMFDAVHVVVSAVRELNRSQEIGVKPLACTSANIWPHGTSLMNYLRMVSPERGGPRGRQPASGTGALTVSPPHPAPCASNPLPRLLAPSGPAFLRLCCSPSRSRPVSLSHLISVHLWSFLVPLPLSVCRLLPLGPCHPSLCPPPALLGRV